MKTITRYCNYYSKVKLIENSMIHVSKVKEIGIECQPVWILIRLLPMEQSDQINTVC